MVLKIFHLAIIMFSVNLHGGELGEVDFDHYAGPIDPSLQKGFYTQKSFFLDDYYNELQFKNNTAPELLELNDFIKYEFQNGLTCPDSEYHKHESYLRYVFRVYIASLLVNEFKNIDSIQKQLTFKRQCSGDISRLLSRCNPSTEYMEQFLKNVKTYLDINSTNESSIKLSSKKSVGNWIEKIKKKRAENLIEYFIQQQCRANKNCHSLSLAKINGSLDNLCQREKSLLKLICSESDFLMGVSYVNELTYLISSSPALRIIKNSYYRYGCLKRFISSNQHHERIYKDLKPLVAYHYMRARENKNMEFTTGLFSVGTLREFEEKGLENVFEIDEEKVEKLPRKNKQPESKPKIVFEKIKIKKYVPIKKKKKIEKLKPKKKITPKPFYSTFYLAAMERRKSQLSELSIDMYKFSHESVFTDKEKAALEKVAKPYTSYKALKAMYKLDKLGSPKAPLPLSFLKYLIDQKMHKELFNLVNVLGNRFYVKNNIDKVQSPLEHIQLTNDHQSNYKWQIIIIE